MNKEKRIQECESKQLIDELSKMSPMVIATAYLHAINYTLYGVDVTEKWVTATQQASALEQAYKKGYYDALQRQAESEDKCKNCEYYRNPDYTRCHECEAVVDSNSDGFFGDDRDFLTQEQIENLQWEDTNE